MDSKQSKIAAAFEQAEKEQLVASIKPNANKGGWLSGKMNGTGQFADSWTYGTVGPDGKFHKTTKPQYI